MLIEYMGSGFKLDYVCEQYKLILCKNIQPIHQKSVLHIKMM